MTLVRLPSDAYVFDLNEARALFQSLLAITALSASVLVLAVLDEYLNASPEHARRGLLCAAFGLLVALWALGEVALCLRRSASPMLRQLFLFAVLQCGVAVISLGVDLAPFGMPLPDGFAIPEGRQVEPGVHSLWPLLQLAIFVVIAMGVMRVFADTQRFRAMQVEHQMLTSLNALSMARDNETGNHILRTQEFVRVLAIRYRRMFHLEGQLTDEVIDSLHKAAPLHDIGKVGIPDQVLLKAGKLDPQEWEIMKGHALIGESVLNAAEHHGHGDSDVIRVAALMAGGHHEKWDGTGYPRGLKGAAIPLGARLMALADVYDALTNARVYKRAWTHDEAVAEIVKGKGAQFDPRMVEAFVAEQRRFHDIALELRDRPGDAGLPLEHSFPRLAQDGTTRSDERFRILFSHSPIGMAMIDHETGEFILVNDALLRSTGYTRGEFMAMTFWDITPIAYAPQEAEQMEQLNRTGRFGPNFKEYVRKDGSHVQIRLSGFLLTEDDGRKLVWGIIEDLGPPLPAHDAAACLK